MIERTTIVALVLMCSCVAVGAAETPEADTPVAPLHEGVGSAHLAITTSSELAQT